MLDWISKIIVCTVVLAGPLTIAWTVITKPNKPAVETTTETKHSHGHAAFTGNQVMRDGIVLRGT